LKHERNHRVSWRIVDAYPHGLIGLEDLTPVRERKRRMRGARPTARQRCANRRAAQQAFADLHGCIIYKAG
jgi:hypothetical protein